MLCLQRQEKYIHQGLTGDICITSQLKVEKECDT